MWLRSCRPTAPALANANSRSRNFGYLVLHALRGLDLPRNRSSSERTRRAAPSARSHWLRFPTTPRSSRSCDVSWNPTWSTPSRIVVRRVPGRRRRRTTVAVDATGLAQGAVSTFLVRRMYHHTQQRCLGGVG